MRFDPRSATPGRALRIVRASATLLAAFILGAPTAALAVTDGDDWTRSSTLETSGSTVREGGVVLNVKECRDQVARGGQEIVTFALDNARFGNDPEISVKVRVGSETCDTTVLEAALTDDCKTVVERDPGRDVVDVTLNLGDLLPVDNADACEDLETTTTVYLIVDDPDLLPGNDTRDDIYAVKYEVRLSTRRPSAPTGITATAGEASIEARWTSLGGDIDGYRIYATSSAIATGDRPEAISGANTRRTNSGDTSGRVTGVSVNTTYNVTVAALDQFGNESLVGEVVEVTTQPVDDFWERYSDANPSVDGGFCFIATAAYGSYQEPHVRVLRRFRDEYLMPYTAGQWFVATYYELSPPVAELISGSDAARAVVRVLLLPLYGFAVVMLYTGLFGKLALALALAMTLWLAVRVWRRRTVRRASWKLGRGRRRGAAPVPLAAAAVALLCALVAMPQAARAESPVDMVFELKAGPYTPEGLNPTFEEFFGDDSRVLFELELDYQLYRGWGSLAIAGGIGYSNATGSAQTEGGEAAIDETTLNWMPLRVSAVYRWDWFWLRWGIPLTLYGKIGLDYWVWWITGGDGETSINGAGKEGRGGTFGWHGTGGVAFVLDWLAPDMASNFDVEWGVNNSYLFAEFIYNRIDDFGGEGAFDLSNSGTFFIGLALEF